MFFSCLIFYLLIILVFLNIFQIYLIYYLMFFSCFILLMLVSIENYFIINTLYLFIDKIRVLLFVLSYFIIFILYLLLYKNLFISNIFIINLMLVSLFFCFFSFSILYLFVFFEFSLLPLFFIIVVKGTSLERFEACVYLLIYTLLSSVIFLLMITFISSFNVNIIELKITSFNLEVGLLWLVLLFIFLVKLPVYSLHRWLKKAHVEAPVEGSMLLAGVLLKLGCFGLYRIFRYISLSIVHNYINFLLIFSIYGGVVVCLICCRQVDIKLLIAFSSVRHMGVLLGGLLRLKKIGFFGSIGMILAHGFCSSALFFVANMFYERVGRRNLLIFKGVLNYFPVVLYFWLLFRVFNIGTPPSLNFFSELLLLLSLFKKRFLIIVLSIFYLFTVVYYNLVLFLRAGHGNS